MLEDAAGLRIGIVEADPGLRAELARALERLGFEVVVSARAGVPGQGEDGARHGLHVIDLAAEGAARWLTDPAVAARCLFLAADGAGRGAAARLGGTVDLLCKPFSIQELERRLLRRLEALRTPDGPQHDPLIQTRSPRLVRVFERAFALARRDCTINLEGELGTGRRALARALHAASERRAEAFVALEATAFGDAGGSSLETELCARVARG